MHISIRSLMIALSMSLLASCATAQDIDEADPLGDIIADMQVAGGRLNKKLTDKPTQQKQKDAISKLDSIIKLLEQKRQQGNGNGSGANPEDPLDDSKIVGGPGGSGPLHDAKRNGRGWGTLPAHKREQILQSMTEGFPPHYQRLLERYYARLAEEKPTGDALEELPATGKKPAVNSPAMEKPGAPKQPQREPSNP